MPWKTINDRQFKRPDGIIATVYFDHGIVAINLPAGQGGVAFKTPEEFSVFIDDLKEIHEILEDTA